VIFLMLNKLQLVSLRFKGKQIADALNRIRMEVIGSLRAILSNAACTSSRLYVDADDEALLRAHQLLFYCDMFAQHPEYVAGEELQVALGCIAMSMNGAQNPSVEDAGKLLMDSFPDHVERSFELAARLWGDGSQGNSYESAIEKMAILLLLFGLQTQQVVALSFKDKVAVKELQERKLAISGEAEC
jgi:hypothetical protein